MLFDLESGEPRGLPDDAVWVIGSRAAAPVSAAYLPRHLAAVAKTSLPLELRYFKHRRSLKPQEVLATGGLAKFGIDPALPTEDPKFIDSMHGAVCQRGTARMASTAQQSAADADLEVFGTNRLFLAGAAVFPTTGFANSTFTAIALAPRLADHLVARNHRALVAA